MIRVCVFLCALALAGCGENMGERQARLYGPNAYKIAGDTVPWGNPPYDGDEHIWQIAIDQRARMQNDYLRLR